MAFTITDLATELGIDPATLQSKPDAIAKWNGYLSQADTQYREAKELVEQAKRDQEAIDGEIKKFGLTEARVAELETANAAYTAALAKAKESGLNIDLSGIHTPAAAVVADPVKALEAKLQSLTSNLAAGMRVQTKFYATFDKPLPVDIDSLIGEATAARMPVEQYAEQKYKFAEETQKRQDAAIQAKVDAGIQAGVTKYREENPVTKGNPGLAAGLASRYPKVLAPRTSQESKEFRSMPIKDRIASSVTRAREAIAATAD